MSETWITDAARDALWFSARLRFELIHEGSGKREYEDRIYLFQGPNPESAPTRAVEVGKQQEHEYTTDDGEQLRWRFVEVVKVMMTFLDTPLDRGIEIYSERIAEGHGA